MELAMQAKLACDVGYRNNKCGVSIQQKAGGKTPAFCS
jgi:hypothetical protein